MGMALQKGTKMSIHYVIVIMIFCSIIFILNFMAYQSPLQYNEATARDTITLMSETTNEAPGPSTWLAGIIIDANTIHDNVWEFLMALNCEHNYGIQIVVKDNREEGLKTVDRFKMEHQNSTKEECNSPFLLHEEDRSIWHNGFPKNRVDTISILRDYQRNLLSKKLSDKEDGIVILVDIDLKELPSIDETVKQVQNLKNTTYPHDAICSNGKHLRPARFREEKRSNHLQDDKIPFYYDTFATVFLSDTFSLPVRERLIPTMYEGEEMRLVPSRRTRKSDYTAFHVFKYIEMEANKTATGNLQVKSCFGGLAMYRAKNYFMTGCRYQLSIGKEEMDKRDIKSIMRYANKDDERPCEHVVLHDCLGRNNPHFNMAINPRLLTLWK